MDCACCWWVWIFNASRLTESDIFPSILPEKNWSLPELRVSWAYRVVRPATRWLQSGSQRWNNVDVSRGREKEAATQLQMKLLTKATFIRRIRYHQTLHKVRMGKRACPNTIIDLTLKSDREQDSGLENVARRPNLKNSTKPTAHR